MAYTPGVAAPCLAIQKDPEQVFSLTRRWNTVAVITDGTAVLGLGDIGPEASLPVMEGKCVLFKAFADIDAYPLCIRSKDPDEIVRTVSLLAGNWGGINLEDIAAPRCFEIERRLKEVCDIPVFHDDQHGTAVVTLAGLTNALRLIGKKAEDVSVVISGAGAAGTAVARLLLGAGYPNIALTHRGEAVSASIDYEIESLREIAAITNPRRKTGGLAQLLRGADVFIGVSGPDLVTEEMVRSMNRDAIIFAMANPVPEIAPETALRAGAAVAATGRSDYPNQINNVLAFPGIFRGALDARARDINEDMKYAAAYALAGIITAEELRADYIIPSPFDKRVVTRVAEAVAKASASR